MRRLASTACGSAALALSVSIAGCGGGQTRGAVFDPTWSNDGGAEVTAFQRRFASTPVPRGADVAIGVAGKHVLSGVSLAGGAPWRFEHPLDARPVIAGSVVVGLGAQELFALDALSGKLLWKRAAGGKLRGAGDDGKTTVVSLEPTTGAGSVILAVTHAGDVVRQLEDAAPIGVPAVVDGFAFLPWKGQYVSVYDLVNGEETARVLLRSQTSRAFSLGGAVFMGEAAVTRFDDHIGQGASGKASTVALPARELPGMPRWFTSGLEPEPNEWGASDAIRLYARPTTTGDAAIEGGRFAATYYRLALGLDAKTGELRWAHTNASDFIGGAAYASGFALCDKSGKVTLLDHATGAVAREVSLGGKVDVCAVQTDALDAKAKDAPAVPLAEQLAQAIELPDAELVMAQKLLLREMAALSDESVTKTLIDLASGEHTPQILVDDARKALAARRNGAGFMLSALKQRYDFLAGVLRPPPVGPLADALAAMKDASAAPLLAAHLNDPADTLDDAERAAAALAVLATKNEAPALETFFAGYRCNASDDATVHAVGSVAEALVRLGHADVVTAAARDPQTSEGVKARLASFVKSAPSSAKPLPGKS
jgi:outer membrane protein assembly factor BamB